jgi:UDP-N-acetylmuramate dehydrogenase
MQLCFIESNIDFFACFKYHLFIMKIQEKTKLSHLTTIKLGGEASKFVECISSKDILEALKYAKENKLKVWILGGGSNTIFSDKGFDGLVLKMDLKGMEFKETGDSVIATSASGENWDEFVSMCVRKGLAGVEALSGIPGSVGATPIQNVGAYGAEVGDTISLVKAIDRDTLEEVEFTNEECMFKYRTSRFKKADKDKYIITSVEFRLIKEGAPAIRYPQLQKKVAEKYGDDIGAGRDALKAVREIVLGLRRGKSMVIDELDPNSQSCGSFFTNPILSPDEFRLLEQKFRSADGEGEIPTFPEGPEDVKVPAAWLIEQSGFEKGFKHKGSAISENHNLALVNHGEITSDVLELADLIQEKVLQKFGVELEKEPIVVE